MKIFSERAYRERLFEEREKAEKERRIDHTLLDIQQDLFELKCRIDQLEQRTYANCVKEDLHERLNQQM